MAKALPASCRLAVSERNLYPPGGGGMVDFFFATSSIFQAPWSDAKGEGRSPLMNEVRPTTSGVEGDRRKKVLNATPGSAASSEDRVG